LNRRRPLPNRTKKQTKADNSLNRYPAAGAAPRLELPLADIKTPVAETLIGGDGKEIGLIVNPAEMDADSRRLVAAELERRYLVSTLRRIISVRERFGIVEWEAETQRGKCQFTTRNLRENILNPSPGYYLWTDVEGNRYTIPDINELDTRSRDWLLRHL
jgi:hypothetical protein